MSERLKKSFKKSNISAKGDFDFYQLKRKSEYLLDCEIEQLQDEIIFYFMVNDESPFSHIRELSLAYKYQVLLNISRLYEDSKRIAIPLTPENLYFDVNMMPKAMFRDTYQEAKYNEEQFIQQYKALIGYVLQDKYSFNDYYQGGNQLLTKNKLTAPYVDKQTYKDIVDTLLLEYKKLQETLQSSMMEVDKKKYRLLKMGSRVMFILLTITIGLGGYFGIYRLQEEMTFNKANELYIKQDYVSVMETLGDIAKERMSTNTKYILAVSNIKVESLSDEQKNNILSSVSLNSDTRILEFWITLGQGNIEESIDLAKQLGNKEYLAYGYMKEKAKVENDSTLSGSEREEKLKEVEDSLENIDIYKQGAEDEK